jgi:excinuclease ABC subunit A
VDAEVGAAFEDLPALRRASEALLETGLGYLELGRRLDALADGEAQRLKLAEALLEPAEGDALFLFDEPTAGLQAEEVGGLAGVFHRLLGKGHTLIVVEHDLDIIARAHLVLDLGPEGGHEGGRVVAAGTPAELARRADSATGAALRRRFGL